MFEDIACFEMVILKASLILFTKINHVLLISKA